jgi:hypothetical protein
MEHSSCQIPPSRSDMAEEKNIEIEEPEAQRRRTLGKKITLECIRL